jgi:hypothetical protein
LTAVSSTRSRPTSIGNSQPRLNVSHMCQTTSPTVNCKSQRPSTPSVNSSLNAPGPTSYHSRSVINIAGRVQRVATSTNNDQTQLYTYNTQSQSQFTLMQI